MGRLIHKFFLLICLSVFSNLASAEFPGVTPGSFSVSDSGAANYVLPISTPAGINGMSPDLSVSYNSSGGNGILGVGFGLNGFTSAIHRCGGSHATDGRASGVTYTNADKLCLNGQRLILTKGNHWTAGAEYHTELETFSKIVYHENGNFLVYSRDGTRSWYQWRVWTSNKIARWLLSSEHDRSGNIIRYYYQHIGNDRWLPKEVLWTGRGSDTGNRKAVFAYKARPDRRIHYDYGVKYESNHAIDTITTYIGAQKIKQYRFLYEKSPVSGLTRLRSITQYGKDGGQLPNHKFTWNNTARGFQPNNKSYELPVRIYDYQDQFEIESQSGDFIDVNNDGYVDYVVSFKDHTTKKAKHAIYKNTGTKWQLISQKPPTSFVMRDFSIRKKNIQQGVYADVNSDGYPDIVRSYSIVYQNGTTTTKQEVWINNRDFTWSKSNTFVPPTLLWTYSGGTASNKNTNAQTDQFNQREPYIFVPMSKGHLIDINGDGRVDWVQNYYNFEGTYRKGVWLNNGSKWVHTPGYNLPQVAILDNYWEYNSVLSSIQTTRLQDVNGDGLVDLVQAVRYRHSPNRVLRDLQNTWLNTGSDWKLNNDYKLPDFALDYTRIGGTSADRYYKPQSRGSFVDVNGDGLVDWVRSYTDAKDRKTYKYTWLNNGKGWSPDPNYKLKGAVINNYHPLTGNEVGHPSGSFFDINRDGLVDWVVAHKNLKGDDVRHTYLNTGSGWKLDDNYKFPNLLIDNKAGWKRRPVHFGGLMDVNSDGAVDYVMSIDNIFGQPIVETYLGKAKPADMIVKIVDSLGAETGIFYKPMTNLNVYRQIFPESDFNFKKRKIISPRPLVSDTSQSNGIGSKYWLRYFYYGATSDGERGYSGFAQRRVWDKQQKIQTVKDLYQEFPATGMTKREHVYKVDTITDAGMLGPDAELLHYQINFIKRVSDLNVQGSVLNYDRITHQGGKYTYAPKIRRSRTSEYEVGQKHIRSSWVNTVYDSYANPTQVTNVTLRPYRAYEDINWANSFWNRTTTQYSNNESSWLIGLPTRVTVRHHTPGQTDQPRVMQTIYNAIGQPRWVVIEPDKPEFKLTTRNTFDGFGNQIETLVFGSGIKNRVSTVQYDAKGMYEIGTTNAEGHTLTIESDPVCEAPKKTTDANGLITTIKYDQFCRQIRTDHPDSTWTTTHYYGNPNRILQRAKGQPDVTTYYDELGRETKVETKGFDDRTVISEKRYNHKGQIVKESQPYFAGDTKYWTEFLYDSVGRLYLTRAADNSITRVTYNGLTKTVTNALNQTHTETTDLIGRLKTVTDAEGNQLRYAYDAVGNLLSTTDSAGNKVKMGYDHAGRKKWMDDPNMGRWKYEYDVLGQLIKQTDAKKQVITTQYDKLGRMTNRTTTEGTSTWEYDTAPNGIGKLKQTLGPNGYKRTHYYDVLSRPKWTNEKIDGILTKSLVTYNNQGKLNSIYYPGRSNAVAFDYNDQGYLYRIYDYDYNGGNPVTENLWVAEKMDAKGNVTKERYGNGVNITRSYHQTRNYLAGITSRLGSTPIQQLAYTMDAIGNLKSRSDSITGAQETFKYDNLNRLKENHSVPGSASPDPATVYTYDYNALGNLIYRSDVGSLKYGENGYGPHAVTSITKLASNVVPENTYNPYGIYKYDANGNLTQNGKRKVTWTTFNKPKVMSNEIGGDPRKVRYTYGTDFQRITKKDIYKNKTTRYYVGGSMEHITQGGQIHWKYYIPVGAATLEIKYKQTGSNATPTLNQVEKQYLFKDHLGSTDVIVDDNGNVVERLSFNPWGERRDVDWTEANTEITSRTNRGFTGHEMDDEIGLVNMNARIYDPVIGRFLSPDPTIPNATDLQSYNRYSYVRNNPLSFTDPSGYFRVPGKGCGTACSYHFEDGNFYKVEQKRQGCTILVDCRGTGAAHYTDKTLVTDPGLKNKLANRTQVASDIIEHYGGLSRGNAKNARNAAYQQARNISGCQSCSHDDLLAMRGHSSEFNAVLDQAVAANDIYLWLKRKARKRYRWTVAQLAVTWGLSGADVALAGSQAAGQVAVQGTAGFILSGGDPKAALIAAASGGANIGISGLELGRIADTIARGTVGGIAAELGGGDFGEGFGIVAAAVGANHLYEHLVGYGIDINPGGDAEPKNELTRPIDKANNVGEATLEPGSCGRWGLCEGGGVSKFFNNIPGINAIAGLHDIFQIGLQLIGGKPARTGLNYPGMVPAAGITALGALAPVAPLAVSSGILGEED